ncbi:MAG: hypothetical protein JWO36_1812 [Myxococcales bacterium]|nr:hypothetical protein [Myxococcales bacterium]
MGDRVFLLGAGFSKAICHEMPLMMELGEAVASVLGEQEGRSLPVGLSRFGGDFEQLLSYLAERQPWLDDGDALRNRAAFLDVSRTVTELLRERQMAAVRMPQPSWLGELIGYWQRMRSTVITFNYDVLVEAAAVQPNSVQSWSHLYRAPVVPAAARTAAVLGGSRPEAFALLKLHGSVTWFWSGVDSIASDSIYDAGLRGGWSVEGLSSLYEEDLDVLLADKVPMVVPPTATKSVFYDNATLRCQWQLAADALAQADELVLIGYSLPPSDTVVRSLLRTTFRGESVIAVDLGRAVVAQARSIFGDRVVDAYCGHGEAVAAFVRATCG